MEGLRLSTNTDEFDVPLIHCFLDQQSYWAKGVTPETVRKSIQHSVVVGGFVGNRQIAFGRAVTDLATFAYLRDVFVLPDYRGKGYGKLIVAAILDRLWQEGVSAIMLGTADAHALYEKFGFHPVSGSPNLMAWRRADSTSPADTAPLPPNLQKIVK